MFALKSQHTLQIHDNLRILHTTDGSKCAGFGDKRGGDEDGASLLGKSRPQSECSFILVYKES